MVHPKPSNKSNQKQIHEGIEYPKEIDGEAFYEGEDAQWNDGDRRCERHAQNTLHRQIQRDDERTTPTQFTWQFPVKSRCYSIYL